MLVAMQVLAVAVTAVACFGLAGGAILYYRAWRRDRLSGREKKRTNVVRLPLDGPHRRRTRS